MATSRHVGDPKCVPVGQSVRRPGGLDVSGFAASCLTSPASVRRVARHMPYGAEYRQDRFYVRILMGTAHRQCYVHTHRRWPRVIVAVAMSHVPAWLAEGVDMQPGAGRILTTHSGSLPRPSRFLPLVLAQEAGESVDEAQFADEVRAAVRRPCVCRPMRAWTCSTTGR
jgi:hypothetical protein